MRHGRLRALLVAVLCAGISVTMVPPASGTSPTVEVGVLATSNSGSPSAKANLSDDGQLVDAVLRPIVSPRKALRDCVQSLQPGTAPKFRARAGMKLFRLLKQKPHRYAGVTFNCGKRITLFATAPKPHRKLAKEIRHARDVVGLRVKWRTVAHSRAQMRQAKRQAARHPHIVWSALTLSGRKLELVTNQASLATAPKQQQRRALGLKVPFRVI